MNNYLDRPIMMHVCKDGTITYRSLDEPVFNGMALPFFSVDTKEEAAQLQLLMCTVQYHEHPKMPDQTWYRRWQFGGELEDIPQLAEEFNEAYTMVKENRDAKS